MPYSEKEVTVNQLIKMLAMCPQDAEIRLYYDGAPRLIPNAAFMEEGRVVLGEYQDIYNKPDDTPWLFNVDK